MAPDPNAFKGSYTSLAQDCRHVIHHSVPSELEHKLSRPADTYGTPPDREAEYPLVDFVCISVNTFLCPICERAMRDDRLEAELAYQFICDDGNDDGIQGSFEDRKAAAQYQRAATIRVVNFDDRMADRTNTISQAEAVANREKKWKAGRRVTFAVEEGMGPGEELEKKEKKPPIILGPPADSAISLPMRAKEHSGRLTGRESFFFPYLSITCGKKKRTDGRREVRIFGEK
jgi:hypothetical protein